MSSELGKDAAGESTFIGFLRRQFTKPKPLPANTNIAGETAIVTGSNAGIGLAASRQLLELGLSELILAVRTQSKGDAAARQLQKEFPQAAINVWILDMESYDSVQAFAKRCESLPRIDIVILNAGLLNKDYQVSSAGNEVSLQVNHLSTALLVILLLPILQTKKVAGATRPPILTVVSSDTVYAAEVELNTPVLPQFQRPNKFNTRHWYANSKLVQLLFINKLAKSVRPDDVLLNMANPGATMGTNFFSQYPAFVLRIVAVIQKMVARPADLAATTYLDAVFAHGPQSHGSFTSDWAIKPFPKIYYTQKGKDLQARLWEETMEELNFANASMIVQSLEKSRSL